MDKQCIVVTGLPASGKSTLGRTLANAIHATFLDKDDYLERLYEEQGTGSSTWRQTLSRKSDALFINDAQHQDYVVLVSHWKTNRSAASGTPTQWLLENYSAIVELYC
ncbi:MAG: AAA family ATPase, partial [Pseudomonadota bacterium]